jgi:hypothetical protein
VPGEGSGQDGRGEVVEFGRRFAGRLRGRFAGRLGRFAGRWGRLAGRRWGPRALLACLVLATVVTVVVRTAGHQARPAASAPAPPPPLRVITLGHPLLGITAGWDLFARGPDDVLRIELAEGRIVQTYVPSLETASPDIAFVIGAHEAVIRPSDFVPGYVVPDNVQARPLTGLLADGGPLVPGPAGSQAAWITSGSPTSPGLSLVTLTGHRSGPAIQFQPGGPQVPATAVSDGRGDVLVTDQRSSVYDTGPGWDRPVPGTVVAVGPTHWLVDVCDAQYLHCRNEVVDTTTGSWRALPGPAAESVPYYFFSWPPTGVISPDGSTAAVGENGRGGRLTVHLIDLRTGATRDLNVPLGGPGSDVSFGGGASEQSMAWSPDGRWLFVAASGGKLVAIDARTGRPESLGVSLPAIDQVAIRP